MIYLNYAALCPTRPEVQQEGDLTLREFGARLYSKAGLEWYEQKIRACRNDVADLLHVSDPSSVAFVPNASLASHLALSFINWPPGDGLLTSTHENPSVIREIGWLAHRGVQVSTLKPTSPDDLLASIEAQISRRRIKAIILSHVSHVDGRIFPIAEIGEVSHKHKVLFIVDGTQAAGHIPVNLDSLDFDLYFFPGHKWCRGPLGGGALIMQETFVTKNPGFAQAGLGWNGTRAGRFEIGTHNIGLIAGMAKACQLLKKEGLKTKEQEVIRETARKQLEEINQIRTPNWAGRQAPGIFTFQCRDPKLHERLMDLLLNQRDIVVKQFLDYPEGETPAIRLSWSGVEDKANVCLTVGEVRNFLEER